MPRQVTNQVVVAILATLLGYSWAQTAGVHGADEARNAGFPVAVVDISKVLNGYRRLAERNGELQQKAQTAEEAMKSRVKELQQLQEELKGHREGSADHKRLVEDLQRKMQAVEAYRREVRQDLVESQSKNMLWAYERVAEQIQQYADARGIKLVVQYNPIPGEGKSAQEIIAGLSRQVVYQNGLDITEDILQAVN